MKLGAFSISLTVKDIQKSKTFYENLDFESFGGDIEQNWLIMKNGDTIIGLFQGMFDQNMLTFNPGWNQNAETLNEFSDVREIIEDLKSKGVQVEQETLPESKGRGSCVFIDPDGNPILLDQHT